MTTDQLEQIKRLAEEVERLQNLEKAAWDLSCYAAAIKWNERETNTQEWLDGLRERIETVQDMVRESTTAPRKHRRPSQR